MRVVHEILPSLNTRSEILAALAVPLIFMVLIAIVVSAVSPPGWTTT